MRQMHRRAALLALGLVLLLGGSARADVSLTSPTPVRAWHGVAVLSVREGDGFRLATQRGAQTPIPLPGIAAASHPFEADIGPGPDGAHLIVFVRCRPHGACRLMRTTMAGDEERAIVGSAGVNGFEHAPAVWRDRVAFARRFADGSERVFVRPLTTAKTARSTPLPGIPRPSCEARDVAQCRAEVFRPRIVQLSMRAAMLVETVDLGLIEQELCDRTEVRSIDLVHLHSRTVASSLCGLSGSTLLGGSLTARSLLWARTCPGDPGGCQSHYTLLYSYGLRDHRVRQAAQRDVLAGFAAEDDDRVVEIGAPAGEDGNCINALPETNPPCELTRVGPIAFRAARSARR